MEAGARSSFGSFRLTPQVAVSKHETREPAGFGTLLILPVTLDGT